MYLTISEARESPALKSVAGSCPSSDAFVGLVNRATRRLLTRGDWANTVIPIRVCSLGGCVVWPRYVGQVRKANVCGSAVPIRNGWYDFLTVDGPFSRNGWNGWNSGGGYSWTGNWWGGTSWGTSMGAEVFWTGGVETPVFQDIMGDGRYLRFYPQVQADLGKTVTVFGVDNNGQTLRHKLDDGTWEDGWVLTLANTYVSTSAYVRRIDRLIFEDHEGPIRAYAYNAADDVLEEVGTYEAHDNNPTFTRYNLTTNAAGPGTCVSGSCACIKSVVALVKLRFIPVRYDTDLVLIANQDALALMMQAIKFEEANDRDNARAFEADAIHELNLELNNFFPVEQTPVGNGVFNGTGVGNQRCW